MDMQTPAVDMQTPAVDVETPAVDVETPAVDMQTPAVDVETPAVDMQTPAADKTVIAHIHCLYFILFSQAYDLVYNSFDTYLPSAAKLQVSSQYQNLSFSVL